MRNTNQSKTATPKHPKGSLYIVATPLGHLDDITLRAIETLKSVEGILAEDTRKAKGLLHHFQIQKPTYAFHEHNEKEEIDKVLSRLEQGESLALITDAGTPLISDPGYHLVRAAQEQHFSVIPIPGPSALIAALSVSGLPTDHFAFEGFLSAKKSTRQNQLKALRSETRTLIFYEAPHRVKDTLKDMRDIFGEEREATLARELTKVFETVKRETLGSLLEWVENDPNQERGEIVLMVSGNSKENPRENEARGLDPKDLLILLLKELPPTKAASLAAKITGIPKRVLYEMSLALSKTSSLPPSNHSESPNGSPTSDDS